MPKEISDTNILLGVGLLGLGAYLYLRKSPAYAAPATPATPGDDPSAPVESPNFAAMKLQDAAPLLTTAGQQGRAGDLDVPLVLVSGMPRSYAAGMASQHLGVDFVWVGDMPPPPGISGPWTMAMGVPNQGPGAGNPFPQKHVPGLAEENVDYLDGVIHYAKTSFISDALVGFLGDAPHG